LLFQFTNVHDLLFTLLSNSNYHLLLSNAKLLQTFCNSQQHSNTPCRYGVAYLNVYGNRKEHTDLLIADTRSNLNHVEQVMHSF